MTSSADKTLKYMVQMREDLRGAERTLKSIRQINQEARSMGQSLKMGFGIDVAARVNQLGIVTGRFFKEAIMTGIRHNATLEQQNIAYKTLLGSAEKAAQRVRMLNRFAATTPFKLAPLIDANRLLELYSQGLLSTEDGMRLVGDAAAGTGRDIREVAFWIGQLYALMKTGDSPGEATRRLLEMGIITGDLRKQLNNLSQSDMISGRGWALAERYFRRFAGGMKEQSESLNGLLSTLSDTFDNLMATSTIRAFGDFKDITKELIDLLNDPQTAEGLSGFLEFLQNTTEIAAKAASAINKLVQGAVYLAAASTTSHPIDYFDQLADTEARMLYQPPVLNPLYGLPQDGYLGDTGNEPANEEKGILDYKLEIARLRAQRAQLQSDPSRPATAKQDEMRELLLAEAAALQKIIGFQQENIELYGDKVSLADQLDLTEKLEKDRLALVDLQNQIDTMSFTGDLQANLIEWVDSFGTAAEGVADIITGTLETAISGISSQMTDAIMGAKSYGEAWDNIRLAISRTFLQMVIEYGMRRAAMFAIDKLFGSASTSAAAGTAGALAGAWAPAAIAASIATLGGADATGLAAYLTSLAVGTAATTATSLAGFKAGRYTGDGDPNAIAGWVHRREYVIPEDVTRKIGPGVLDQFVDSIRGGGTPQNDNFGLSRITSFDRAGGGINIPSLAVNVGDLKPNFSIYVINPDDLDNTLFQRGPRSYLVDLQARRATDLGSNS